MCLWFHSVLTFFNLNTLSNPLYTGMCTPNLTIAVKNLQHLKSRPLPYAFLYFYGLACSLAYPKNSGDYWKMSEILSKLWWTLLQKWRWLHWPTLILLDICSSLSKINRELFYIIVELILFSLIFSSVWVSLDLTGNIHGLRKYHYFYNQNKERADDCVRGNTLLFMGISEGVFVHRSWIVI